MHSPRVLDEPGVTVSSMTKHHLDLSPTWVHDACTLPTAEQPLRVAEFDDLLASAVTSVRRIDPTRVDLVLDPQPEIAARTAELAARETVCCSFFEFVLSIREAELVLQIRVPDSYADVLDEFAVRAEGAARLGSVQPGPVSGSTPTQEVSHGSGSRHGRA